MLVPFAIQPTALAAEYGDVASTAAAHRRAIAMWEKHGVLVHSGARLQQCELMPVIANLPQAVRIPWERAVQRLQTKAAGVDWPGVIEPMDREQIRLLAGNARVFGLSPAGAQALALPVGAPFEFCQHSSADLVRYDVIDEATAFKSVTARSVSTVASGARRDQVWEDYLAPLVQFGAAPFVIVDRYCAVNEANQTGLAFVIEKLIAARCPRFTLFAGIPFGGNQNELRGNLTQLIRERNRAGALTFDLQLPRDEVFGALAHDRYFRASGRVMALDIGLAVFGAELVRVPCRVAFGTLTTEASREAELRRSVGR